MFDFILKYFHKKAYIVWHQDSPGSKVVVYRNIFTDILRSKEFSEVGEKYYWHGYEKAVDRTE